MTPSNFKLSSKSKYLNLTKKCLSIALLQEKYDIKKARILIQSKGLLMNLAGTKRFRKVLLTIMPFLIKPFAVYSITSFDVNGFICDGKEFVEKYILANEVI